MGREDSGETTAMDTWRFRHLKISTLKMEDGGRGDDDTGRSGQRRGEPWADAATCAGTRARTRARTCGCVRAPRLRNMQKMRIGMHPAWGIPGRRWKMSWKTCTPPRDYLEDVHAA